MGKPLRRAQSRPHCKGHTHTPTHTLHSTHTHTHTHTHTNTQFSHTHAHTNTGRDARPFEPGAVKLRSNDKKPRSRKEAIEKRPWSWFLRRLRSDLTRSFLSFPLSLSYLKERVKSDLKRLKNRLLIQLPGLARRKLFLVSLYLSMRSCTHKHTDTHVCNGDLYCTQHDSDNCELSIKSPNGILPMNEIY